MFWANRRCVLRWLLGLSLLTWLPACSPPSMSVLEGEAMGTRWKLVVAHSLSKEQRKKLQEILPAELARLTRIFSTWDPNSVISQFNASTSTEPFEVPPEVIVVACAAHHLSVMTQGSFDVTIEPVLQRLGLQPSHGVTPSNANYGFQHLEILDSPPRLRKKIPHLQVNYTALVEGLAIDRITQLLKDQGYGHFMFELGGEVYASGRSHSGKAWKVGVVHPDLSITTPYAEVELVDEGVSTSGTYRSRIAGKAAGLRHILDARTGKPVSHANVSITVKHKKSLWADAWATALMTMEAEEAQSLSKKQQLSVLTIRKGDLK